MICGAGSRLPTPVMLDADTFDASFEADGKVGKGNRCRASVSVGLYNQLRWDDIADMSTRRSESKDGRYCQVSRSVAGLTED